MGTAVKRSHKFRRVDIYETLHYNTAARYVIIENIKNTLFYVLHKDFLRSDENNDEYLHRVTIERLLDTDFDHVPWAASIDDAIQAHDEQFDDFEGT
jgi:hypothetical protein